MQTALLSFAETEKLGCKHATKTDGPHKTAWKAVPGIWMGQGNIESFIPKDF